MNPTDARFDPHSTQDEGDAARWISTHEAARLLGVSARSIQRRCSAGTLPARRVQGERREVWEVEAQAVEAERQGHNDTATFDSDTRATTTATQQHFKATATPTTATGERHVAVNSSVFGSKKPNDSDTHSDRKNDSDSDTATFYSDNDSDTRPGVAINVAVEAERLRAQLEASRAETARERELNAFLKSQIEEGNRNAAELRKALNEALKIAPRQLTAPTGTEGVLQTKSAARANEPERATNQAQQPAQPRERPLTYADIADELERSLNQ